MDVQKSCFSCSDRVSQTRMRSILRVFGQLVPPKRLTIFLGNSLSFGSSRFQDQVVKSSQVSPSD